MIRRGKNNLKPFRDRIEGPNFWGRGGMRAFYVTPDGSYIQEENKTWDTKFKVRSSPTLKRTECAGPALHGFRIALVCLPRDAVQSK